MARVFASSIMAIACAAGLARSASATIYYGTNTSCDVNDIYPGGGITNGAFDFTGGEGFLFSSASVDFNALDQDGSGPYHRGFSRSATTLSLASFPATPPRLQAEARLSGNVSDIERFGDLPVGGSAYAQARGLDVFQYIGAAPTTLTITFNLHADVHRLAGGPLSGAYARMSVMNDQMSGFATDVGSLLENGASFLTSLDINGDPMNADAALIMPIDTGGPAALAATIAFDVLPGQVFYVVAGLGAGAEYGTDYTDAYNTAYGTFDQPEFVVALSTPAPGAGAIMLGAAGLIARRRRR